MSEQGPILRRQSAAKQFAAILVLTLVSVASTLAQRADKPAPPESSPPLLSIEELAAQPLGRTNRVRIEGTLTGFSPPLRLGFLQIGDSAVIISNLRETDGLSPGQTLEVEGAGVNRWSGLRITAESVRQTGVAPLPEATPIDGAQLFDARYNGRRVEVRGVVLDVQERVTRLLLRLQVGDEQLPIYLGNYNWMDERLGRLTDSIVRVRGVLNMRARSRDVIANVFMIAPNADDLTIEEMAPEDPFGIEASPIGELKAVKAEELPVRRVRVQGMYVRRERGLNILVDDGENAIWAEFQGPQSVLQNDYVDVVGWLRPGESGNRLSGCDARMVAARWPEGEEFPLEQGALMPAITAIRELRGIGSEAAARGVPARLRGVVTYFDLEARHFFVQDGQAAVRIRLNENRAVFRAGELVEVTGNSVSGPDMTELIERRVRRMGGGVLPVPRSVEYPALAKTALLGAYVSVSGRVRGESIREGELRLQFNPAHGSRFEALVSLRGEDGPIRSHLNSVVRVTGICQRDEQSGVPQVLAISPDRLEVLESMPSDLFELPVTDLGELAGVADAALVQVEGTVTHSTEGEDLVIQEGYWGLVAEVESGTAFSVGDRVRLVGSLLKRRQAPLLRTVAAKRVGRGAAPVPVVPNQVDLEAEKLAQGDLQGRLVRMEGLVLGQERVGNAGERRMLVGDVVFTLAGASVREQLAGLEPGARVSVVGPCKLEVDANGQLSKATLLPRTAEDINVLREPRFWTVSRVAGAILLVALGLGTGVIWVTMLRRRVRQQTRLIRRQLEKEERLTRLAIELGAAEDKHAAAMLIADAARDLIGWEEFVLDLYDAETGVVTELLSYDTFDGEVRRLATAEQTLTLSELTRSVVVEGASELVRRNRDSEVELLPFGNKDRRSEVMLYAPLKSNGRSVGLLSAQSYDPTAYDENDLRILTELARNCGDAFERLESTEALRASETRFRTVTETLVEGVVITGLEGDVLYINAKMAEMTGWTQEEVQGRPHYEVFQAEEDWERARQRILRRNKGQSEAYELRLRRKDGTRFLASINAIPFRGSGGAIIGSLGCYENIDDRRRAEEQLRHSQKMEAVGQLAAGIAHDFNNLLTIIGGHTGLLLARAGEDARQKRALEQIAGASDRAAELTSKLLTFSREQSVTVKPVHLQRVVEEFTPMIQSALGETVATRIEMDEAVLPVMVDVGMIGQLLTNLAVNARDAMPRGGELFIRLICRTIGEDEPDIDDALRPGEYACLEVEDTGDGIEEEILDRIFEPFFSTKEVGKGTGLGLASVYGIVQQHEGWVDVDSQLGEGTTFRIMIPIVERSVSDAENGQELVCSQANGETILLVEDEPTLLTLNKTVLEGGGYRVLEATTAVVAREVWREHKDGIDLLLTDVVMPGGMNGCELARGILAERPDLPVVLMSGYSKDVLDGALKVDYGVNFLAKPFRPKDLLETVGQRLADEPDPMPR